MKNREVRDITSVTCVIFMGAELEYPEKANNIKQIVFRSSIQTLFDQNICAFLFRLSI